MVKEFLKGAEYVFQGIILFYRTPALWKYALIPLVIVLLIYAGLSYSVYDFAVPHILSFLPNPDSCSEWLRRLIQPLRYLIAASWLIATLIVCVLTLSTAYEIAGALFFDAMVVNIEESRYNRKVKGLSCRANFAAAIQSMLYSVKTLILTLFLLILSFLIPVIGTVLSILIIGYRIAIIYLFSSGFNRGYSPKEIILCAKKRKMMILGFGVSANLLLLFLPLAAIFLLPGFVAAGVLIYNEELGTAQ